MVSDVFYPQVSPVFPVYPTFPSYPFNPYPYYWPPILTEKTPLIPSDYEKYQPIQPEKNKEPFLVKYGSVCKDEKTGLVLVYNGKEWICIHERQEDKEVISESENSNLP